MNTIAINGNHRRYGGVKMRGRALAAHRNCLLAGGPLRGGYDTVVAMKLGYDPNVRARCERLIWDPLDAFHPRPRCAPIVFWRRAWHALQFDDVIATSPACAETMAEALPAGVAIHVVPHQCDDLLRPAFDPAGPIVYAGLGRYIDHKFPAILESCHRLGKEFRWDRSQRVLENASLALCLRCPPTDTPLNRSCKPQIKLENAAAAGLPIVTTDCPAALTRHPELRPFAVPADFTARELERAILAAAEAGPISRPYTVADYLRDMDLVLRTE